MNRLEAQFLLSAYRPNGADALDANLDEALRFARGDPGLAAWFSAQRNFDAVIAQKLREVVPAAEMRDQLHAGITLQLNEHKPPVGRWLALATFVMILAVPVGLILAGLPGKLADAAKPPMPYFMNETLLYTLAMTGFGVAFLHAAIPTHWLPFVVIGRARGWSRRQILGAVALAGGGHILATTALGVGLAMFGFELNARFDQVFHWLVAAILVGLGLWMAFRVPHGSGCNHCQGHPEKLLPGPSDRAALWGLFLTLTLSPCELFLPVYLTAVPYGWSGVVWLSVVLALATLGGMLTLTWLTLHTVQRLRWSWLERLDQRVIGGLLCLLGIATVTFAH